MQWILFCTGQVCISLKGENQRCWRHNNGHPHGKRCRSDVTSVIRLFIHYPDLPAEEAMRETLKPNNSFRCLFVFFSLFCFLFLFFFCFFFHFYFFLHRRSWYYMLKFRVSMYTGELWCLSVWRNAQVDTINYQSDSITTRLRELCNNNFQNRIPFRENRMECLFILTL